MPAQFDAYIFAVDAPPGYGARIDLGSRTSVRDPIILLAEAVMAALLDEIAAEVDTAKDLPTMIADIQAAL